MKAVMLGLRLCMVLQNNVGAVANGGSSDVVFQANAQGYINMYIGTTPPIPGTCTET